MMIGRCEGTNAVAVCGDGEDRRTERPAGATSLLEVPDARPLTGDLATQTALLLQRSLAKQRRGADERQDAFETAQQKAEDKQVSKMREEADKAFAQAMASCAISVGASVAQIVSGGLQMKAGAANVKAAPLAEKGPKHLELMVQAKRAEGLSRLFDGIGTGMNALNTGVSGAMSADIKHTEADAKVAEQSAGRAGRSAQRQGELSRELGEIADKTMQRLEALLDGAHQTRLALIQRM